MKILLYCKLFIITIFSIINHQAVAQKNGNPIYVDNNGVMRWTKNNEEAAFFGVNYTIPFAYGYRSHKALGLDIKESIDKDVYHLARLGLDAFRVHVWDTEISDSLGNLIENEHLKLYDYLIFKLKQRNIKIIVTPIAFWGNGYPEKDEKTHAFSDIYNKPGAVTDEKAFVAQENYLRQFFDHKNAYTNLTYQEDPDVIAAEINNEPRHSGPKKRATEYINRMAAAIRSTGWSKPVFYNISESPKYADAVAKANIDGVSFQWYPTGLVSNHTLKGNYLPNVDAYNIPFDSIPEYLYKARMVYEFDAGDVLGSYIYPAMARSFRTAGFQWASQFAYDPLGTAYANTEYQTHYVNLAYTPKKAISLMIASKAFHDLPRLKDYGRYPTDSVFGKFRVSYKQELSEMNSGKEFYYSNTTHTNPRQVNTLEHLAGVGSSPVVRYTGTGAYFLDKIQNGIWRLEVMPDAIHTRDPFERASLKKEVTRIAWNTNTMQLVLPEMGMEFSITGVNEGNKVEKRADHGNFTIVPGTYLLTKKAYQKGRLKDGGDIGALKLNEFVAPQQIYTEPYLQHQPKDEVSANMPFNITAKAVGLDSSAQLSVAIRTRSGFYKTLRMERLSHNDFSVEVPVDLVVPGVIEYRIMIKNKGTWHTFPGNYTGDPRAWDYLHDDTWTTLVVPQGTPLTLFNANPDQNMMVYPNLWKPDERAVSTTATPGQLSFKLTSGLSKNETMGWQLYIGDKINERKSETADFRSLSIKGRTSKGQTLPIKITLIDNLGHSFSGTVKLDDTFSEFILPLDKLQPGKHLLLPRPYPGFHPLWFETKDNYNATLDLSEVEKLEVRIDESKTIAAEKTYSLDIIEITLKK